MPPFIVDWRGPFRRAAIFLALAVLGLFFSGCATLNENQCRAGDWSAYGEIDGRHGLPAEYWRQHESACREYGISVDKKQYEAARQKGLAAYCTPESGYQSGLRGDIYWGVCAGAGEADFNHRGKGGTEVPLEMSFLQKYELGRKIFLLRQDRSEADQELQVLDQKSNQTNSVGESLFDALGWTTDGWKRRELEDRKRQTSEQITDLQMQAPAGTPPAQTEFSNLGPGLGALTGTLVGFGTGHAVQGRYGAKGWIFTASEAAAIGTLIESHAICGDGRQTCDDTLTTTAVVGFLALRIWEVIDVWRYFNAASSGYPHLTQSRWQVSPTVAAGGIGPALPRPSASRTTVRRGFALTYGLRFAWSF